MPNKNKYSVYFHHLTYYILVRHQRDPFQLQYRYKVLMKFLYHHNQNAHVANLQANKKEGKFYFIFL